MKRLKTLLLSGFATMLLFSCSKDDDNTTPEPPASNSIIGKWKLVNYTTDKPVPSYVTGTMTTDVWKEFPDCSKDNTLTYQENSTAIWDEGPLNCNPSDPQTTTWNYSYQHPTLIVNGFTSTVLQLDATTLKESESTFYYFINSNQEYDSVAVVATKMWQRQ